MNVKDINIRVLPKTIGQIMEYIEEGLIVLKSDKIGNTSETIESILMGIPLPSFYVSELDDNKMYVDSELLNTIYEFYKYDYLLINLQVLVWVNGLSYNTISKDLKRRITSHNITLNVIGTSTPEAIRNVILERFPNN